jgi:hypothetical protein
MCRSCPEDRARASWRARFAVVLWSVALSVIAIRGTSASVSGLETVHPGDSRPETVFTTSSQVLPDPNHAFYFPVTAAISDVHVRIDTTQNACATSTTPATAWP